MPRLFLDMDGTLARFHDEANYLERMFEEDFFSQLKPFDNMVAGAKLFMQQHPDVDVYVISSCVDSPFCVSDKNKWLDERLNIPPDHRIFPPLGASKADYIPGGVSKDDHLVDDYNRGLNQFMYDGGSAIKCHNNINQQGLGAHGGSPGNLWTGPMVHVDDKPEMIAAELADIMGLTYDLAPVKQAYPEAREVPEKGNTNTLDDIRWKSGKADFQSYKISSPDGQDLFVPGHRLKAVSLNVFQSEDFLHHLYNDPFGHFHSSVANALKQSQLPQVGRIDLLDCNGELDYSRTFYSREEMDRVMKEWQAAGANFRAVWYVNTKSQALSKIKDPAELCSKLESEHKLDHAYAARLATALTTPTRTKAQTDLLVSFWNAHKISEPLQVFLGLSNSAWKAFSENHPHVSAGSKQPAESPGLSLAAKILNAEQRCGTPSASGQKNNPAR